MRMRLVGSLFLTAALLAGCESSKEAQVDFMGLPKDMAVDIWHKQEAAKPAAAISAPTSAPDAGSTPSR
jgi:hypothetical protein